MDEAVRKVTAFITRKRDGVKELLVFKHPTAGIQIPAGTVSEGEDLEVALRREVCEETGLKSVETQEYLGCLENELEEAERVVARTTYVYIEPDLNAIPYRQKLPRGLTVKCNSVHEDFTQISYTEYYNSPDIKYILHDYTGWVPSENLSAQKTRYFYHLTTLEETEDEWEVKGDPGHIFKPHWTPLSPKPQLVENQDKRLDFVWEKIS